jgi:hypothetical protein
MKSRNKDQVSTRSHEVDLKLQHRILFSSLLLALIIVTPVFGEEQGDIPDDLYPGLEYLISLSSSEADLQQEKLSELVNFIFNTPRDISLKLKDRNGASGAFHGFTVQGDVATVLDYAYNPELPIYVTMPSSLKEHSWLTPGMEDAVGDLLNEVDTLSDTVLLRGRDRETITPDTNTGAYYTYDQDRLMTIFPGPGGPVLISVSIQTTPSVVGKKGCVAGEDSNWNYLYSDEKGIDKTGLGWVDSYMYHASSVIIYVSDSSADVVHIGSFKWLNAGWAKINMVKSSHILKGIKRFAEDFRSVLESPALPEPQVLSAEYKKITTRDEDALRQEVSGYLQELKDSRSEKLCGNPIKSMVTSGAYLEQMGRSEMVRILLLEYLKKQLGRSPSVAMNSEPPKSFFQKQTSSDK